MCVDALCGRIFTVGVYPEKVQKVLAAPRYVGEAKAANAVGAAAAFECGTSVRFTLRIEPLQGSIEEVRYTTTGCGFMIAAAEHLAESLEGALLSELHALSDVNTAGDYPPERHHCGRAPIEALRAALAAYREQRANEFRGETALICTCFGVTEEVIEAHAATASTVEEIGELCNAGTGCGSCRMLIQEILDAQARAVDR